MIRRILLAATAAVALPIAFLPAPAPASVSQARTIQMAHISVEVIGEGAPVILVPGLSSPRAVWDGVAPGLAKTHRVYLVQVNGFGGDDPRANLEAKVLDGLVADLATLIAAEKLEGAAMVGHSMGGLAGLMLARARPGLIGRLMVVDALPYIGEIFVPGATVAMLEPQAAAMRDQMKAGHGRPLPDAVADQIAATNALRPEARARVAAWAKAADLRVVARAFYEDMTTDLRGEMAAVTVPVTLLYPWAERLPKERADALYRAAYAPAPRVTYVPVADSGHFIMLDQPEAFRAALAAFLAS